MDTFGKHDLRLFGGDFDRTRVRPLSVAFDDATGRYTVRKAGFASARRFASAGAPGLNAASALEHALINRFGTLGKVTREFLLRSDYGLIFTSRRYTALVRSHGLKQEFNTPHCRQQNGMVERVIRALKEQCTHLQRLNSIQHATRAIGDWISFSNNRRPLQALDMKTPAAAFASAA